MAVRCCIRFRAVRAGWCPLWSLDTPAARNEMAVRAGRLDRGREKVEVKGSSATFHLRLEPYARQVRIVKYVTLLYEPRGLCKRWVWVGIGWNGLERWTVWGGHRVPPVRGGLLAARGFGAGTGRTKTSAARPYGVVTWQCRCQRAAGRLGLSWLNWTWPLTLSSSTEPSTFSTRTAPSTSATRVGAVTHVTWTLLLRGT